LIAQTADGYAAATSDLTKFVNKKPDLRVSRVMVEVVGWLEGVYLQCFHALRWIQNEPSRSDLRWLGASTTQRLQIWMHRIPSYWKLVFESTKKGCCQVEPVLPLHTNYRCGLDQAARYGRGISKLGENLDGESAHRPLGSMREKVVSPRQRKKTSE
jgi:hypothetical protein